MLRPLVVGGVGALGVAIARDNLTRGPAIVGVATVVAVLAVIGRERGAAVAALGIGAAGAFAAPNGLGPLLVVTGAALACDVAAFDRRLLPWRDVIDAVIPLPALAGLAGTVAAQPSQRAIVLGATAGVVVVGTVLRTRLTPQRGTAIRPSELIETVAGIGGLTAAVFTLAPGSVEALGDLPAATLQASRSVAAGVAVFTLAVLVDAVRVERAAPAPPVSPRHRAP